MSNPSADYPSAIHTPIDVPSFAASALGGTSPTHTAVEGKQEAEIVAMQTALGINPTTVTEATTPTATPSTIAEFMDMVATQLKAISGGTNWYSSIGTSLATHVANTSNPHSVTKSQVGLSAVTNDAQLTIANNLSDLANAATARTNLGVVAGGAGDVWVEKAGDTITGDIIFQPSGNTDKILQIKQSGDTYPREYMDGYGSLYFGGSGSSAALFQLRQDPYTSTFMNITNTVGPVSILVLDSDVGNSGGPNAESTYTGRVIVGSGGSEWVDWFHNHYSTNGDWNYGILMQKLSPGIYRSFVTAFTDNAVSNPSLQIKDAEWFSVITPTIETGAAGGTGLTGTGATTASSTTLTGTGTAFLTELKVNDSIAVGSEYRTITVVTDNTHVTVSVAFSNSVSGATINKMYRFAGRMGIRVRNPTAYLHIGGGQAGGATVGSAQFKIDSQALLTTPEAGAIETDTTSLYFTISTTRYNLLMNNFGVSGGQTLVGGNASGNGLSLSTTSHATKGFIYFGTANGGAFDETNSRIGLGTIVPTHGLTLGSSGNGLVLYNTSDQVTNYERLTVTKSGNVFTIQTENAGTGTQRALRFGDSTQYLEDTPGNSGGSPKFTLTRTTSSSASLLLLNHAGMNGSSGNQYGLSIAPTVAQSSTAGYEALRIDVTESSTGSGAKNLINALVGSSSYFSVNNQGVVFPRQLATASAPSYVKGGMYFDLTLNKMRIGGASAWETVTSV